MKRALGLGGVAAIGLAMAFASPATAMTMAPMGSSSSATIYVPSGFDHALSDTRPTGHYEVQGSGLRVYTDGATGTDKVAEYVDTNVPLSAVGEPALNVTANSGTTPPGFQLLVDFDGNGTADGFLVGEPTFYGNDWWASNGSAQFVKDGAPSHEGGSGSANHGTLAQWRTNFPHAVVVAFGFALGSYVQGDWLINSIDFDGTNYTFANDVILTSKDQCKNGGWATSTAPYYSNQGQCVSHFASSK